jgi:uncharacterized protein (TIGR03435 family)
MTQRLVGKLGAAIVACAAFLALGVANVSLSQGQSVAEVWEKAAGGKMEFDVVSVRPDVAPMTLETITSNFPLGPGDMYTPNGGLFHATNYPLFLYIAFAYKMNSYQTSTLIPTLPKWVMSNRYDIEAHASGNPTKDQMRLMMQALLTARFKLAIRAETRESPIFALVLDKPGKVGPQLRPYPDGTPCGGTAPTTTGLTGRTNSVDGIFPVACGGYSDMTANTPGHIRVGARNVTIQIIADQFPGLLNTIDRPVYDRTGLTGTYDFSIEFVSDRQIGGTNPADDAGPTFLEALKEQLGLKLNAQTGPSDVYVIDHIEEPSAN